MKLIRINIKKHQKEIKYIGILLLISFLIAYILLKKIDHWVILNEIKNIGENLSNNHINYILFHLIIISIMLSSSLIGIGLILFPIYILFELVCISFNTLIFIKAFSFSGLIYSLIFNIITKLVYLVLIILMFKSIYIILKTGINFLTKKDSIEAKTLIYYHFKKIIYIITFILLNDILLYLIGNKILLKLTFIL